MDYQDHHIWAQELDNSSPSFFGSARMQLYITMIVTIKHPLIYNNGHCDDGSSM